MGTLISVRVADENLSDAVFNLFHELDMKLSTYKSDSEISRLNRDYEINASKVTGNILERSLEMNRISHGAFDITIGSLSHGAYHFGGAEKLPTPATIHHALAFVGGNHIQMENDKVRITPGTIIDLGGIGKGYAVDLAIELLSQHNMSSAIIAASGDIGCLGPCDVKITDPFHPDGYFGAISSTLPRFAISTSGNYERYIRTKEHNHLLNPKTGKSERIFASVTLMGEGDNTKLDALATAVSVMHLKDAIRLLQEQKIAYILILNDGTLFQSEMPNGVFFSKVR